MTCDPIKLVSLFSAIECECTAVMRVCMLGAVSLAHVRKCLVYETRNLSTKNIFCQQKKKTGNFIGQVYAAKLFIYFGNGKCILVLTKLFGPEQNILVLTQIWFGPKEGPGS